MTGRNPFLVLLLFICANVGVCAAQDSAPLTLVETISRPGVQRKWDHFRVDLTGHRLFVASEIEPVVEVFDLRTNKLVHIVTGLKKPHNILLRTDLKKIFVVDGEASEIKVLQSESYKLLDRIALSIDADPIAYDPESKLLYVVNGGREAHTPYCLVSVVDTSQSKKLADIKLDTNRLEAMALEKAGDRLFVNMTGVNEVGVIDRQQRKVIATWPITAGAVNSPMQLDEADHRLFVVTRKPAMLVVFDTQTGHEIANVPVGGGTDDLAYDAVHRRLYAPSADGFITVVEQQSADKYRVLGNVPTAAGAKTALLVPELNRYYVGVPSKENQQAGILVFSVGN
ncbi:MAG: YncE family protein [Terriglobales bacterium]